ncbi:hypothetical protein N7462_006011 [Penicillium macrosclerotiorum]|uniref:uncharacterized protein n=1 Tax=Penicillium macrosclerotiorum TaxID=303699 RepID=UPI002546960D|nr:uncharacterized protein N7462_006011 [Penicillium macrosclerotiorum]KAJ5682846.1 hypothetical protein N7462_006011 [Penicillium macrosclerotiorum]
MKPQTGFSLHVTIYIKPSDVPTFFEHFKPVYEKVVAEPECRFFEVYQSLEDPGTLRWVENWGASFEWFMGNQAPKEYYKEYLTKTQAMFIQPREMKVFDRLGPPYYTAKDPYTN